MTPVTGVLNIVVACAIILCVSAHRPKVEEEFYQKEALKMRLDCYDTTKQNIRIGILSPVDPVLEPVIAKSFLYNGEPCVKVLESELRDEWKYKKSYINGDLKLDCYGKSGGGTQHLGVLSLEKPKKTPLFAMIFKLDITGRKDPCAQFYDGGEIFRIKKVNDGNKKYEMGINGLSVGILLGKYRFYDVTQDGEKYSVTKKDGESLDQIGEASDDDWKPFKAQKEEDKKEEAKQEDKKKE